MREEEQNDLIKLLDPRQIRKTLEEEVTDEEIEEEIENTWLKVKKLKEYLRKHPEHSKKIPCIMEYLLKKLDNLSFEWDQVEIGELSEKQQKEFLEVLGEWVFEWTGLARVFKKIDKKFDLTSFVSHMLSSLEIKKGKIFPTLEPMEKNLINLPIWYPSVKGLPKQKPEVRTWRIKKGNLEIEYDYQLSLPTVLTFEVAGILLGIWQDQNYSDTFFTSLNEICRRKGIPPTQKNRNNILTALRQLHNTRISAPLWEINKEGEKRRKSVWKISIVNIEAENIQPGRDYTLELRINKYIAANVRQNYYTLLNYEILNKLKSSTAKRLYAVIKQYSSHPYQRKLSKLKKLLNLRDKHAIQTIKKASQELVNIGFLTSYKIEKGKKVKGLVYRAYKSKRVKDTRIALKGH